MANHQPQADRPIWEPWFEGKDFTSDWASRAFPNWIEHLRDLNPSLILEIGAYEGRASIFFLNFFPQSHLTCVDTFNVGNEQRFDTNVMRNFPGRVRKISDQSISAMTSLAAIVPLNPFDLIYVDGSHDRDDVLIDSILAWRLLKVGGVIIWDDYDLFTYMGDQFAYQDQNPKPAVDVFLSWHVDEMSILHKEYQVIVKKTKPHYAPSAT